VREHEEAGRGLRHPFRHPPPSPHGHELARAGIALGRSAGAARQLHSRYAFRSLAQRGTQPTAHQRNVVICKVNLRGSIAGDGYVFQCHFGAMGLVLAGNQHIARALVVNIFERDLFVVGNELALYAGIGKAFDGLVVVIGADGN